ncbi:hypothetical protein DER45DRAFT_95220 [Fusarium avenaceum]|nr:hypothetical protein DER45DRAFT_95220 [Fusarium avenaceum]
MFPMSAELDSASSQSVLREEYADHSVPRFSNHIGYYVNPASLCFSQNTISTPVFILRPSNPYTPAITMPSNIEPGFILRPSIDLDVSSSMDTTSSMEEVFSQTHTIHTVGLSDIYSIPSAWNLDPGLVQSDNCWSSPTTSNEPAGMTVQDDPELVQWDPLSWLETNQHSSHESIIKDNINSDPILPLAGIKDSFRFLCNSKHCTRTFKRKEHATRHYKTKHDKKILWLTCEFCGKNTFTRTDNLNAHRRLHARERTRQSNGVHFVPAAAIAMKENPGTKRGRPPRTNTYYNSSIAKTT